MTGHSAHFPRKAVGLEYRVYFALIFATSLPFAAGGWILGLGGRRGNGVLRRAWRKAGELTPMIFAA